MAEPVVEVIPGLWRNVATGKLVLDPISRNGVVYVHVKEWGWFGDLQYFYHDFERVEVGGGDGEG